MDSGVSDSNVRVSQLTACENADSWARHLSPRTPTPELLIQEVWGRAQNSVLLRCCQVMLAPYPG